MILLVKWLCDCTVKSILLIQKISRLNLELRLYDKVLWKIKLNVLSTANIFHLRKNIQTVINTDPMLLYLLFPSLIRFTRCFTGFASAMQTVRLCSNRFPFLSDVAFDDSLILIKFAGLIVISFLKTFSFLKAINIVSQGIVWRQTLRFTEDINQLQEVVWAEAIDA